MKTFMLFCFVILGLAFYQLSGGADFEPEQRVVAEAEPVVEETEAVENSELALVRPENTPVAEGTIQDRLSRALVSPEVVAVSLETTTPELAVAEAETAAIVEDTEPLFQSLSERLAESTETAEVAAAQQLAIDLRQVASSRVNMRNGPGTDFSVLVTLNSGTAAEVIETNGDGWVRVRVRDTGQEGWMAEYLLEPVNG